MNRHKSDESTNLHFLEVLVFQRYLVIISNLISVSTNMSRQQESSFFEIEDNSDMFKPFDNTTYSRVSNNRVYTIHGFSSHFPVLSQFRPGRFRPDDSGPMFQA